MDLGDGVNAITGESDQGKSALIRAVRWLLFNKPDGQQYRKHGTKETVVTATLDDGTVISRVRAATVNRYVLERPDEETQVFDNFGKYVPQPIVDALGVFPASFTEGTTEELSVSMQFDGPFLLSSSGIVKAQVLGKLSKTSIIDTAVKAVGSEIRASGKHLNIISTDIERILKEIESYDDLPAKELAIDKLDERITKLKEKGENITLLKNIAIELTQRTKNIELASQMLGKLMDLPDTDDLTNKALSLNNLLRIRDSFLEITARAPALEAEIGRIDEISQEMVEELNERGRHLDELRDFYERTQDFKRRFVNNKKHMKDIEEQLGQKTNEMLMKIRLEGKCPTCLRQIDDEDIERIQKEILSSKNECDSSSSQIAI
jgi:exonuclease SbcC